MIPPARTRHAERAERSAVYTVPQVARLMGMGRSTLYELIQRGACPFPVISFGPNSSVRIPKAAVDRVLGIER